MSFDLSTIVLPDQGDGIIRTKDFDFSPNPKGFGYELFVHMKKYSDNLAQIDAATGETHNYKDLLQRCVRAALHLKKLGITAEDIISPCTSNHVNAAVAMVAPLFVGAKIACIDAFSSAEDIKEMAVLVKPKLMFVCEESLEKIDKVLMELDLDTKVVVFGATEKYIPFSELLRPFAEEEEKNFEPVSVTDLQETAVIAFSSGSTGAAKGICLNHYTILYQLGKYLTGIFPVGILYATLSWITAQIQIAGSIMGGAIHLICSKFTPEKTWEYLVKYKASVLCLTQKNTMAFLKYGNPDNLVAPNLMAINIFGGKISLASMDALKKFFPNPVMVFAPYGLTETYGSVFGREFVSILDKKPDCVGTPAIGSWYKIVDPVSGRICGANEQGELRFKTEICTKGYYNQDNSDYFDSEGFLKTGDILYYDEDYCFFIVGRLKEVIRYDTYWIPLTMLENILYEHPAVKVATVVGLPTEYGDLATGVVLKFDSAKDVTEEELLEYVNGKVDDIRKIRGGIIFVEESVIPFAPTGKIRKYLLKKYLLDNLKDFNLKWKPVF